MPCNLAQFLEVVSSFPQDPSFDAADWLTYVMCLGADNWDCIKEGSTFSRNRLRDVCDALKSYFVGKDDLIDLMMICLIAGEPMLILGETGTAKSHLVTKLCEAIGVRRFKLPDQNDGYNADEKHKHVFEYLLNPYTQPDELFGPVKVNKLTQDNPEFERFSDGMLSDSYVVFLDEIFRANSAILNALLSLVNERRVYEAGRVVHAVTLMLFGAANELRHIDELRAFYERFPIRAESIYVNDKQRMELLEKGWGLEYLRLASRSSPVSTTLSQIACLSDVILCNRAMAEMWGGETLTPEVRGFAERYCEVVTKLGKHSWGLCRIDDRKFIKLFKIVRAKVLFERGVDALPDPHDLLILRHTWDSPDADTREALDNEVKKLVGA